MGPGASTHEELTQWETRNVNCMLVDKDKGSAECNEMRARLKATLMQGVCFNTVFSGTDCAREALARQVSALQTVFGWDIPGIDFESSTDNGAITQKGIDRVRHCDGQLLLLFRRLLR